MSPDRSLRIALPTVLLALGCAHGEPASPFVRSDASAADPSIVLNGRTLRPDRHFDFEDTTVVSPLLSREMAHGGSRSLDLSEHTYSPAIRLRAGDVAEDLATVATGCWLSCSAARPRIGFVMTIERGGEQVAWFGKDLRTNEHEPGKWERFNAEFLLRETKVLPDDSIIYYIWNRDRDPLFVDDLDLFFHSANVPGRPLGAAVHVDSLSSKDMPPPFAPCTCEPFPLLERSRRKIIGEPVDSLGQPLDSARVARGFTWYRTGVMPLAELRDADGKRIAWVRPFCASLGIDLLSFERVIVRSQDDGRLLVVAFDMDERNGRSVVAAEPPPVAALLTIRTPGMP